MTADWDAIVVGARVAGSSTAMLLARAGLRVLVLERARAGTDALSTHALMRAGTLQLSRWGLLDRIVASGTPAIRRTIFTYGNDSFPVTIKPAAGVGALYAPRRTVLDPVLAEAAEGHGAVVRYSAAVTGLLRDDGGRVTGVRCRGRDGRSFLERAPLVIGADGKESVVAVAVGAPTLVQGSSASAFLYSYVRDLPPPDAFDGSATYEFFYAPRRSAGAIPTTKGLTCVFVGGPPHDLAQLVRSGGPADAFGRILSPAFPGLADRLACGSLVEHVRYDRGRAGHLRRAWGPGWALVGDAGYWKDPLSTHGITDALRDAELLARAVLSGAGGGAAAGPRLEQALAQYQATRDRLSLQMVDVVERIAGYSWDLTQIQTLLRQLKSAMTQEVEALAALSEAA